MVRGQRGSMLVAALLLSAVLLLAGMGLHAAQLSRYRQSKMAVQGHLAVALAEAGIEDARVKLEKDPLFPPPGAPDQVTFNYSESLPALSGSQDVGSYNVTVDMRFANAPHHLVLVRSEGVLQGRSKRAIRQVLRAEFDSRTMEQTILLKGEEAL